MPARHVLREFGEVTTHVQTCKRLERDHINFLHMFQNLDDLHTFSKAMFDVALIWPLLQNQSRKAAGQAPATEIVPARPGTSMLMN